MQIRTIKPKKIPQIDFANKNIALTCQVQTSEDLAENLNEDTAEE